MSFISVLALLTVSICFAAANAQPNAAIQIPTVRYCDLLRKPDAYDGKQIRLRAEYDSGFEHSVFADSQCVKRWDANKLIWVEFDDAATSNTNPNILVRFEQARYRQETDRDGRVIDKSLSWYVTLTVVGIFRKSKDPNFGFGQQSLYPLMITVSKTENVGTLKKL